MTIALLQISNLDELAQYFGVTYPRLTQVLYRTDDEHKYFEFTIPKKNGAPRLIQSPNRHLKALQRTLAADLAQVYRAPEAAHGFIPKCSIRTNALPHLQKDFVFNVDLEDFFPSIHFGRVRGLFSKQPFGFPNEVATVLAHLCCFKNRLPQGAPTSPIVSNMICRKMDRELVRLASRHHCTYTRYADDLSFSFTGKLGKLPRGIVQSGGREDRVGPDLALVIKESGFRVNERKVWLAGRSSRMEVTGLTVNVHPNVRQRYVRQLEAMLYAWDEFKLDGAQREFTELYDTGHRPSHVPKDFSHVVAGKLAFLYGIKGVADPVYVRLATKFNGLIPGTSLRSMPLPPPGELVSLLARLRRIPPGRNDASEYERAVEALFTALFRPSLTDPVAQHNIHQGRKRVDITYTNVASTGFFRWVGMNFRAAHVFVECKNYSRDIANPELDQLSSRFSTQRGQLGLLVCRSFDNKDLFLQRCRDTAVDRRGYILALDDDDIAELVDEYVGTAAGSEYSLLKRAFDALIM